MTLEDLLALNELELIKLQSVKTDDEFYQMEIDLDIIDIRAEILSLKNMLADDEAQDLKMGSAKI